jgi:hypothetical protein
MCKHQQQFGLDVQFSALVLNFNNVFSNEHLYRAGQTMNSLPSQILERCALFKIAELGGKFWQFNPRKMPIF